MCIEKGIDVLKINNLGFHCLKHNSAFCKSTFKCKSCNRFPNSLIHFNISKSKTETSDTEIVYFRKKKRHQFILRNRLIKTIRPCVNRTALGSNLKNKNELSTALLYTVN